MGDAVVGIVLVDYVDGIMMGGMDGGICGIIAPCAEFIRLPAVFSAGCRVAVANPYSVAKGGAIIRIIGIAAVLAVVESISGLSACGGNRFLAISVASFGEFRLDGCVTCCAECIACLICDEGIAGIVPAVECAAESFCAVCDIVTAD